MGLLRKYECTTGIYDPRFYHRATAAIRAECREAGVRCSKADATLAARVLLQVAYDADAEPHFCGGGRARMLSDEHSKRLERVFAVIMRPNITNPIADSAHGLCNSMLGGNEGFKRTVRHGRTHLQITGSEVIGVDPSLQNASPVLLQLK